MTLERFERVVVDTSVVSILFRGSSDDRHEFYWQRLKGIQTTISFQTLEELWFGIYYGGWGNKRTTELIDFISDFDVVWPDEEVSDISARLRSDTRKAGRELKPADAWIAATAISLKCPLATDNGNFDAIADRITLIKQPR